MLYICIKIIKEVIKTLKQINMKQLELELNKRLLIVEYTTEDLKKAIEFTSSVIGLICKGSELTEEVAKELVELHVSTYYKDYLNDNNFFTLPSKSFISAIEAKGWKFGKNNIKYPIKENYGHHDNINVLDDPPEWDEKEYYEDLDKWMDADRITFNPEKTLIFEIL